MRCVTFIDFVPWFSRVFCTSWRSRRATLHSRSLYLNRAPPKSYRRLLPVSKSARGVSTPGGRRESRTRLGRETTVAPACSAMAATFRRAAGLPPSATIVTPWRNAASARPGSSPQSRTAVTETSGNSSLIALTISSNQIGPIEDAAPGKLHNSRFVPVARAASHQSLASAIPRKSTARGLFADDFP